MAFPRAAALMPLKINAHYVVIKYNIKYFLAYNGIIIITCLLWIGWGKSPKMPTKEQCKKIGQIARGEELANLNKIKMANLNKIARRF